MNKEKFTKIKKVSVAVLVTAFLTSNIIDYYYSDFEKDNIVFYDLPQNSDTEYSLSASGSSEGNNSENTEDRDSAVRDTTDLNAVEESLQGLIDINSATSEELQQLYRIGPVLAEKIINYRESYGYYETIEEIKEVSGIGDKTYEQIKDYIKAGNYE